MSKPSQSLSVTIIQSNLYWEDKAANLRNFEAKINGITDKMEVVLLPEMFNTGFSMNPEKLAEKMNGETVRWMKKIAIENKIILAGSVIIEENDSYFNRLLWVLPNGDQGFYDKRHLFAYGGEDARYTSGRKRLIASVKGWRINLLICYDLRFPVWSRQTVPIVALPDGGFEKRSADENTDSEYDVLVYVANWPEKRAHAWKTLLQARAIENQCYVIGVNRIGTDGNDIVYSGDSMIVDPMGSPLVELRNNDQALTFTLKRESLIETRSRLPFLKDADPFIIGG